MSYSSYTTKLKDLEKFIRNRWVKTPKDIARKLKVSPRTALRMISQLKEKGYLIKYSAKEKSYIFSSKK